MAQTVFNHFKSFVFLALAIAWGSDAFAIRIARFSAIGQNVIISNQLKSDVDSNCSITITNTSNTPQVVTVTVNLFASVASGTDRGVCPAATPEHTYFGGGTNNLHSTLTRTFTLAALSTGTGGADCTSASNTCTLPNVASGDTMSYPLICAGHITVQNVRCEGEIKVDNSVAGVPGHITASGTITTFVESMGGVSLSTAFFGNQQTGTSKTNTAAPTFTPITIGEGRPF